VAELRTNEKLRSEEFDKVAWTKSNATVTADTIVAPDGTLTGDVLSVVSSGRSYILSSANTASNTVLSNSIFVKAGNQNNVCLTASIGNVGVRQWFNLATATSGSTLSLLGGVKTSSEITSIGNDWYRISLSITASAGVTQYFILDVVTGDNVLSGNSGDNVYIWGAQLEAGSFSTSYIKTEASQVTRSADSASMTGANFSDWYNPSEGTWVFNAITPTIVPNTILLASNISANQIYVSGGTGRFSSYSPAYATTTNAVTPNVPFIGAVSFNSMNNINTVLNGGNPASATYTNFYANQITASFGATDTVYFKRIAFYPQVSSVAQLQALTS